MSAECCYFSQEHSMSGIDWKNDGSEEWPSEFSPYYNDLYPETYDVPPPGPFPGPIPPHPAIVHPLQPMGPFTPNLPFSDGPDAAALALQSAAQIGPFGLPGEYPQGISDPQSYSPQVTDIHCIYPTPLPVRTAVPYLDPSSAAVVGQQPSSQHPHTTPPGERSPVSYDSPKFKLTQERAQPLIQWYDDHKSHPYPSRQEKLQLCQMTQLTYTQVSTWFANARRRNKKQEGQG